MSERAMRPLRRVGSGHWSSRDGRWTFMRHWGDPDPQRWFAYLEGEKYPANEGSGDVRLRDAVESAERVDREESRDRS